MSKSRMGMTKELKQLIRELKPKGWTWGKRNGGHVELVSPKGIRIICGTTLSYRRAMLNIRADVKRVERTGKVR